MQTIFDKHLEEFQRQTAANPEADSVRYYAWLQVKLLDEINTKLDKLLLDKAHLE